MEATKTDRLVYGDVLRCLAAFAVVLLHCAGASLAAEDPASTRFLVLNVLDGACRWAVPMFVMISGAFLLDPEKPMGGKKWLGHLRRAALLLVFWSVFYAFADTYGIYAGAEWCRVALTRAVTGQLHYHLWYLPALLGLYLLIPPLRALIRGASRRTLWYLAGLWGAVALGARTLGSLLPGWLGQPWVELLRLSALTDLWGYLLLGYLLKTCALAPRRKWVCYALGVLGLAVTWGGTWLLSLRQGGLDGRLYEYLTPNVALTAAALFLAARRRRWGGGAVWAAAAPATLGVYLLHPLLLLVCQNHGLPRPGWGVWWAVPAEAAILFAVALGGSLILRRIPKVGKILF